MSDGRLRLRVLGPAGLTNSAGEDVDFVLSSPKRLALLACLCAAPGFVGRDAVLGLLWHDEDQEHARNALNQLLHRLRRDLGRGVLESRGSELIGVDRTRVWSDLDAFETAIAEERLAEAVDLYRGEVLQGFYLSNAPAFERWLENHRDSTRRAVVTACRKLAARAPGESAVPWLRRALEIAPNQEVLLRELLIRLDASGDRAGAIKAYADFRERLARDLGTRPSPETAALVAEIMGRDVARGELRILPIPAARADSTVTTTVVESAETCRPAASDASASDPEAVMPRTATGPLSRSVAMPATAVVAIGLAVVIGFTFGRGPPEARSSGELSDDVLLVAPFEASGSDVSYLAEGIVELLTIHLDGDGGPRAVDSRTALSAWSRAGEADWSPRRLRRLGEVTGAGRVVKGRALETARGVLLSAELIDVRTGDVLSTAQASADFTANTSAGPLTVAVERLASDLLAGELNGGLMLFTGAAPSLGTLKEYLAGRSAYRRGAFTEAVERYRRALDQDSTFAYAALGLLEVGEWPVAGLQSAYREGRRLARAYEDLLSRRDRAYMTALSLPADPPEVERAWVDVRAMLPDRPEVQFQVADHFFHVRPGYAPPMSHEVAWDIAAAGFQRVLELDPSFSPAVDHLFLIALASGNETEAARLADWYGREFPDGHAVEAMAWALARAGEDSAATSSFRARAAELPESVLLNVYFWSHYIGISLDDALHAAAEGVRRGHLPSNHYRYLALLNAGRPGAALAMLRTTVDVAPGRDPITAALYSVGDSAAAEAHAHRLSREQNTPLSRNPRILAEQAHGTCALAQWRLWHSDRSGLERALARIRAASAMERELQSRRLVGQCVYLLEALDAVLAGSDEAGKKLSAADSVFGRSPAGAQSHYAELLLSRLHERIGDRRAALHSVRRRCWFCPDGVWYLADFLRAEARLAAATGDLEGAAEAYTRYLAMRGAPEQAVWPQVDSVRREFARLSHGNH
ncbi:MAG: BTAD domain-containing putative transcriptional regulator [Gemmatimonadota bacterium]